MSISIGAKIRYIRKLRSLTQKDLGIKAGFPEATADIRIRQYEHEKMKPKTAILQRIADALEVDVVALSGKSSDPVTELMYLLFDLEREYGLYPVKKGKKYLLRIEHDSETGTDIQECLSEWYQVRKKYLQLLLQEKADRKDYEIWKQQFRRKRGDKNE